MTFVLCSKGYHGNYKKNKIIENIKELKVEKKSFVYHAGTKIIQKQLYSNGGRVLNIISTGAVFKDIRKNILKIIKKINWKYGFFRKDIGWRIINK